MARPVKSGLNYFPMDVDMDDKVELIEAKHGITGFGILIKLYQKIYKEGYYINWKEETSKSSPTGTRKAIPRTWT